MESNNTLKYLIGALVIVFIIFSYFYFSGGSTTSTVKSGVTPVANVSAGSQGGDPAFLQALLNLKNIELNKNILSDQTFLNLKDFSRELVDEPKGRINPFAPFDATLQTVSNFSQTEGLINSANNSVPSAKAGD